MIGAVAQQAARPFKIGLWAAAILVVGVALAIPEQSQEAVLGAGGVAAAILSLIQPLVAIALVLFAIPFGSRGSTGDPSTESTIGAAELAIALLTVAWLARGVRQRELRVRANALVVALFCMAALAGLSIGYALDQPSALKETLKWLELLLGLLIVVDLVREPTAARWVIGAMLLAGAAEAAYGVMQFVTDSGPAAFDLQGALRAFGHFDQPNPFAGYLTTILPMAGCMALCSANDRRFRLFALAASGVLVIGIGVSQSRGAWLGGAVAVVTLLLAWSGWTRRLLVPCALVGALVLALALSGLLPASIFDRLAQAVEYFGVFDVRTVDVTSDNWAVVERMAHWQAGWYMFLDHTWLGVGAGNYAAAYPAYAVGMWLEPLGHAHNYYINMLAELGVVGGAILLLILGLAFTRFGSALIQSEVHADPFWRSVLAGSLGALVVFCVHNHFDSLFVHSVNIQIGVVLGLGLVAAERARATRALEVAL